MLLLMRRSHTRRVACGRAMASVTARLCFFATALGAWMRPAPLLAHPVSPWCHGVIVTPPPGERCSLIVYAPLRVSVTAPGQYGPCGGDDRGECWWVELAEGESARVSGAGRLLVSTSCAGEWQGGLPNWCPWAWFARDLTDNGADFNLDGDIGTDADLEAFMLALARGGCDFDGDGDADADADIESFFRVLAGGVC